MTPLTRSTLLVVLLWCGEPKMSVGTQRLVQPGPEGAREARVAVRDEHVGQPDVAEHRRDEVARRRLSGSGLEGRDQPHAPGQLVDVHLQEVVPRAGGGELQKVEADAPAAARGYG